MITAAYLDCSAANSLSGSSCWRLLFNLISIGRSDQEMTYHRYNDSRSDAVDPCLLSEHFPIASSARFGARGLWEYVSERFTTKSNVSDSTRQASTLRPLTAQ